MGRTIIITGASQGIGRATAVRMAREPDVGGLALIARNADGLEETRASIGDGGPEVDLYPYDLLDLDGIRDLVGQIRRRFTRIDALCNIAGYAEPRALLDTTNDNIVRTYTINVMSMMVLIRETVRAMQHRRSKDGPPPKILNVASTAGITSRPGWLAYASSKAAVVSLSATLSDELAGSGIKVYAISPGRCATELRRALAPEEDMSTIMQPEEVADVIARLLDPSESTLDGQNIIVRRQI